MATYKYRMGGGTDSIPKKAYEMGGMTAPSIEERVEEVKAKILEALEGGATDEEIKVMVRESGLEDKYEFNWDSVEMKVEARPIEGGSPKGGGIEALMSKLKGARSAAEDRFGPKDAPGQRGDMFDGGGKTASQLIKEYQSIMNRTGLPQEQYDKYAQKVRDLRAAEESDRRATARAVLPQEKAARGMRTYDQGGRTYAGQYMGKIMQDEGGKYAMYDDGEGNQTKAYFMEDPGQVGEFVPDNDYLFETRDGKTFARLAEGFEDQRNPKERQIGKEVMQESTKGASKIENLLEKLQDMGRKSADGRKTYRYEQGGVVNGDPKPPSWIASDPKFTNVTFLGANYEDKLNRASGFGGEDFRFDLKGVKFYGMDDDGLTFVDENGNGWSAERDYETGNPDDQGGGYDDVFNYLKDMGAVYSEEYEQIVKAADEKKKSEPKGPTGTIIHKNGVITGSGDINGKIIDLRPGRENLSQRQLKRGLKQLLGQ